MDDDRPRHGIQAKHRIQDENETEDDREYVET
jgi:hypothetical protein